MKINREGILIKANVEYNLVVLLITMYLRTVLLLLLPYVMRVLGLVRDIRVS